jgi:hypothetical protein
MSLLFLFLLSIPATILQGYVVSQLWLWFIVPLGVVNISVAHGIGIALIVSYLTARINGATDPAIKGWTLFLANVFGALFVWGFAYIIHLFM